MPSESQQRYCSPVARSAFRIFLFFIAFFPFFLSEGRGQPLFLENGNHLYPGADAGFLLDSPTRLKVDLSGSWNYILDDGTSGSVQVPSAYTYRGHIVFQRGINLTQELLDNYTFHLVMLGVAQSAEVSLNGEFILSHVGGSTGVIERLQKNALQAGRENVISIRVSNVLDARTTLPLRPGVWGLRNYGGITRDIFLLGTPPLYVRDAVVQTDPAENGLTARVSARVSVEGADSAVSANPVSSGRTGVTGFYFEIFDKISGISAGKSPVAPLVPSGTEWVDARAEIVLQTPKLWSPETPDLYLVKCYLVRTIGKEVRVLDECDLVTGVRKIASVGKRLLLNGKRLIVKGVNWYEDHPTHGSALTYEERERDVVLIKNLGANLVRFVGHPPHPYMLNLCDRYGLLAMVELPVVRVPGPVLGTENFADLASTMLREMIVRDRNHPSVMAWGLGDEFESSHPLARHFVESLVRTARSLDGRPLYYGAVMERDSCTDLVDIAAVSAQTQDLRVFRTQLEGWRTSHKQQPVIALKFGTEVQHENRNGYSDPLSQEAQARFFLQRFEILRTLDYDGGVVWSFNDWAGDRPALTVHSGDPMMHTMGLVNAQREKRVAYEAVRALFHGEKFVALPIGTHTASAPIIYVLAGFVVLIGMAYLYNANRRMRESLNRSIRNSYNFFTDVRDQRIVSLAQSTLLGVVVSLAVAIVASSVLYRFRDSLVLDDLLSLLLVSDGLKSATVTLIWSPMRFIGIGALLVFVLLLLVGSLVHFLRAFVRARIYPFHAYTVTMWSTAPLLILVPVGMLLYRVMDSSFYTIPVFILLALLLVWVFLRLLKGISIIVDMHPLKMYLVGFVCLVVTVALVYVFLDYAESAPMYVSFIFSTVIHLQ